MNDLINEILKISNEKEGKSPLQLIAKCMEELGEVAEALLSYEQANGCGYKNKTIDDVREESVDVLLVIVALMAKLGMDEKEITSIAGRKLIKWQKVINE